MKNIRVFLAFLFLMAQVIASGQDFTNKGKDFWLCFPSHVPSGVLAKMNLFLTSDQNSSGTITVGSFSTTFTITANQVTAGIDIPYTVANIAQSEAGTTPIKNKAIHVQVDNGKPAVVLYAHIYAAARSEASLILPTNVLGKKYFSFDYIQNTQTAVVGGVSYTYQSQFNVIAVEANTQVKYQLRKNGILDATSTTVTLQDAGDMIQIQNTQDLTGSIIESVSGGAGQSCKKIAVFSGSSAVNIGQTVGNTSTAGSSTDPLFQQCYPVNTWGKSFGLIPFVSQASIYHYRVLASEDNTTVNIDGTSITLNAGQFYPSYPVTLQQTPVSKAMVITADKPISVAQYMISSNLNGYGNGTGDPEMVILNPIEQNISDISVFSSTLQAINGQYLNVFTKWQNFSTFKINGTAPKGTAVRLAAPNDSYGYLIENLTSYNTTSFRLTADSGFNGICYGIGNVESYGYSAGTSLRDFTPPVTFQNPYNRIDSAVTCVNTALLFSVPLSFSPASIKWDFSAAPNISPNTVIGPSATVTPDSSKTISGQTINYYSPGKTFTFKAANTAALRDTVKLYTTTATPDGCGSTDQVYSIPIKVNDIPAAKFVATTSGCVSDSVLFTDQSAATGGTIKKWLWNFGDNTTDDRVSGVPFSKKYATGANYTVKLKIVSDVGCSSDEASQTIQITDKPVAKFTFQSITCAEADISFTDASTTTTGTIAKWVWSLDDGAAAIINTTNASVKTKYMVYGTKNPTLTVETATGCKSDVFTATNFKVNPLPEVNFGIPEVCLSDANAPFTDSTKIAEGSLASYLWNFNAGTPAVSPGPNITSSAVQNPQVKYNKSDNYFVSLKVTSAASCVGITTLGFTVNGSIPKSVFELANPAPYCGTRAVQVKNLSTVDFGNVTKIEIYWDFANAPTVKEVIDIPVSGKIYPHSYADPVSTKQYTIRMVAYSGGTACSDFSSKTITVYPLPKAAFTVSASQLCFGDMITFSDKSNGKSSAAVSWQWDLGKGVLSNSQNPVHQYNDSGLVNVSLYFTNADGCVSDTAAKTLTIYPNPKLTLKHNDLVLSGGTLTIKPLYVYGNQLQYLWTPATYLSRDTSVMPKCIPDDDITYKLTLTAEGGCTVSDTVHITVLKGPVVPNVFSPNGDGINDTWRIKYLESYEGATVEVYNRAGQIVFRSTGYSTDWDGTYKGSPLPVGTYYYIINPKNSRPIVTGSVTIIK
jgi:gliding motility-associated-like protein